MSYTVLRDSLIPGQNSPEWIFLSKIWPKIEDEMRQKDPSLRDERTNLYWVVPTEKFLNVMITYNGLNEWTAITWPSEEAWTFFVLEWA